MANPRLIVVGTVLAMLALPAAAGSLDRLQEWMTGSFSSEAQAAEDESFFDIRLEMVPIWTARDDGPWLYVEQAAASRLDQPYRQRVYHLSAQSDGSFRSEVYELPEPLTYAGAWRDPQRLDTIGPDDLKLREGCAVVLRGPDEGGSFVGSTLGDACKSTLRGASYATSEVSVTGRGITSWDRGYSAEKEQVWGAEKGPYVFRRKP